MLEIFLFVNPIGSRCLETEKDLLKLTSELDTETKFTFVPYVSIPVIGKYMALNQLDPHDLKERNRLTQIAYAASLDVKAASLQGKMKARNFVMALQTLINEDHCTYNEETVNAALEIAHLDREWFQDDRCDPELKALCQSDETLIQDYHIGDAPTVVAFNTTATTQQAGVLIEDCSDYDAMKQIFERLLDDELFNNPAQQKDTPKDSPKFHIL